MSISSLSKLLSYEMNFIAKTITNKHYISYLVTADLSINVNSLFGRLFQLS